MHAAPTAPGGLDRHGPASRCAQTKMQPEEAGPCEGFTPSDTLHGFVKSFV